MDKKQAAELEDTPRLFRLPLRRAWDGKASPRAAIRARCLQCTGFIRADIRDCTAPHCALYAYRPYQKGAEDETS